MKLKGEEQFAPANVVICATGQRPAGTDFVNGLAEIVSATIYYFLGGKHPSSLKYKDSNR